MTDTDQTPDADADASATDPDAGSGAGAEEASGDVGVPSWLPDPVVAYRLDGGDPVVVAVSPAFERAFAPADPAGRPLDALLAPIVGDPGAVLAAVREGVACERVVAGAGETGGNEGVGERVAGGEHADDAAGYLVRVVPPGEGGDDSGHLLLTDVSDLQQRVADLTEERDRLSQFASVVAHDVRNQIGTARLRLLTASEDPREVHFEKAMGAIDRMESILDDALRIGREGRFVDGTEPVDLAAAAADAWTVVAGEDATLDVGDLPTVAADPGPLRELLENLFQNAVQHAGPDVSVAVVARPDGFAVVDDGPGISPEERDRVFEPGYSGADGTGLGLAIVERVAAGHGWSVSVTDAPEGGCEIRVTGVEAVD